MALLEISKLKKTFVDPDGGRHTVVDIEAFSLPEKAQAALRVAEAVLTEPVADRINWTLPRLADEIERREGIRISTSRLSVVLRKKGVFDSVARGTL